MLTIENIERLINEPVGNWKVIHAGTDDTMGQGTGDRYILTLRRDGDGDGAAVFIWRFDPLDKGNYRTWISYGTWDDYIFQGEFTKEQIGRRDAFLGMVLHKIDTEYRKRHKNKK